METNYINSMGILEMFSEIYCTLAYFDIQDAGRNCQRVILTLGEWVETIMKIVEGKNYF